MRSLTLLLTPPCSLLVDNIVLLVVVLSMDRLIETRTSVPIDNANAIEARRPSERKKRGGRRREEEQERKKKQRRAHLSKRESHKSNCQHCP